MGVAPFSALYAAPTATAKAHIGQLAMDPMGGLWRYFRAGAAITNPLLGCGNYQQPSDASITAAAVGALTVDVTSLTVYDSVVKDQFADGTLIVGAAAANRRWYHIRANTYNAADDTTLTLWHPVRYAIAGTEWATLTANPWYDVRHLSAGAGLMSVVCMPMQPVTAEYYAWGKTRGPIFGVVSSTVPGAASNDRLVVFQGTDGAMIMADESWNAGNSQQIAGWLIPRTGSTYAAGDQTVWLQIE